MPVMLVWPLGTPNFTRSHVNFPAEPPLKLPAKAPAEPFTTKLLPLKWAPTAPNGVTVRLLTLRAGTPEVLKKNPLLDLA